MVEVPGHSVLHEFGDGTSEFDPGRSGPDDQEGQQLLSNGGVVGQFGRLEDAAANPRGVLDGFPARSVCRPIVVAEIAVGGAGREHLRAHARQP